MKPREEDEGLVFEQFLRLNHEFYESTFGPADYLDSRVRALALATCSDERVRQAAVDGLQLDNLKIAYGQEGDEDFKKGADRFAAIESAVLLHHAGESLIRLYLAHKGIPPCPWLETARLRNFKVFKERVAELVEGSHSIETRRSIMEVFTGIGSPESAPQGVPGAFWEEQSQGLADLISHVGGILLEDANLYNASKHGLAVFPDSLSVRIGPQGVEGGEDFDLSGGGIAVRHLQASDRAGKMVWEKKHVWVSTTSNVALTALIVTQIRALWEIASARYVKFPEGGIVLRPIRSEWVKVAVQGSANPAPGFHFTSMTEELLYWAKNPSTDEGSDSALDLN